MQVIIGKDNKIELPIEVIQDLDLHPGNELLFVKQGDGYMIMPFDKANSTETQRLEHTKYVLNESKSIMDRLTMITLADDVYTEDEIYLTNVISEKLLEYQEYLEKILRDNKVDLEEYEKIENYKQNILDIAQDAAAKDNVISVDEEKILYALKKIIDELH